MNLLPAHLPSPEREQQLVENVLTVEYAIGRALGAGDYVRPLRAFAAEKAQFGEHFASLERAEPPALAAAFERAASDSMDTFNLFSPKQCNLACNGCYTAAKPTTRYPYDAEFVETYFQTACSIIAGAKRMGARTIYTSGDGELTTFPRFFDLLDFVAANDMQWLFFTAGLAFSSEVAAEAVWADIQRCASPSVIGRIRARLRAGGSGVAAALLAQLGEYRDHIQVYHSLWTSDAVSNDRYRNPQVGAYEYVDVETSAGPVTLPSSVPLMLTEVFDPSRRDRFGIEMPVGAFNVEDVCRVATFAAEQRLKSYFEPVITTGRNAAQILAGMDALSTGAQFTVAPLLVRETCSFRNIYQPTLKVRWTPAGAARFYASPGMGIDLEDLEAAGVLEPLRVGSSEASLFGAVHAPLMSYAAFAYPTGCKCNDFALRLRGESDAVHAEWQRASSALPAGPLDRDAVAARLRAAAPVRT